MAQATVAWSTECFNPVAVVVRAEALSRKVTSARSRLAALAIRPPEISAMPNWGNPPSAIRRAIEFADRENNLAQAE